MAIDLYELALNAAADLGAGDNACKEPLVPVQAVFSFDWVQAEHTKKLDD